jgi:signal transduction histidine kinase
MTRRLILAMTALVAGVAIALALPLAYIFAQDQRAAFVTNLEVDTLATASLLSSQAQDKWQATADSTATRTGARVVVVDTTYLLVADSDASGLDRTFARPEMQQALGGELASASRYSSTLNTDLRYVAAPVVQGLKVVAAVRLSLPESDLNRLVWRSWLALAAFVVAVMVIAALLAWVIARSIAAPMQRVAEVAAVLPDDLERRANERRGPAEVRAVAHALNSTAGRLSGILRRQERVAADASHHLRTPLTGVRLRLEAIEDISGEPDVREQAAAAMVEVDRLSRRIDQVLALARSDAGAGNSSYVNASEIVHERVRAAAVEAQARGIDLRSSVSDGVQVLVAPGVFDRIVDELLGNAFLYARETIIVDLSMGASLVHLRIGDDGPGLPEGERAGVFERFQRGSTSVPGGSGLGLALVRESARAAGGDAEAGESPLGGFAVHVTLPATPWGKLPV